MRKTIAALMLMVACVATALAADDTAARMDALVATYAKNREFMGAVLVARDDKVVLDKAYGDANLEWSIPNTTTTKFRLGSITKQFTAACILLLEERGKLHVEDPIKQYLPDSPATWDKITLFNLLTHTSGIPNLTALPGFQAIRQTPTTVEKTILVFRDKPLVFQPGEKWQYSNSNFVVLGAVIEKLTGGSYEKFVTDNIFTPLGMKDSGYDSNSTIIAHRASGYSPNPSGIVNADYVNMTVPHAAGALYSTTGDLWKWERALYGGKVLSPASLKKMTTAYKEDYGFGLLITDDHGRKLYNHGGSIEGFNTALSYYPDTKVAVVVLANINGAAPQAIARQLGAVAHGETVHLNKDRTAIAIPAETLQKYVGTYAHTSGANMMLTLDGDHLLAQLSGQPKFPLKAESPTLFYTTNVEAQIEFAMDAAGNVTNLTLHQGGRDTTFERTSSTVLQRTAIPMTAEQLGRYVGTYRVRPGLEFAVTLDGDHLYAQLTGQPKAEIFPEAEGKFFYKIVDAQIEFDTNAAGPATALTLHQGRVNLHAEKQP